MALWRDVALSDMRKPGFTGSYIDSYALNDDAPYMRPAGSDQSRRALLTMGRYPDNAWGEQNPDRNQILYLGNDVRNLNWTRILFWNQLFFSTAWKFNHMPGFQNNTRVLSWDHQVWMKSKSTGQWRQLTGTNSMSVEGWTPDFRNITSGNRDVKSASNYVSGASSVRPLIDTNAPQGGYWIAHGYSGSIVTFDKYDVADVLVSQKTSLILNDEYGVDDRQYSRYVFACGADYYPPSGTPISTLPGFGCSRHKYVTARWPEWQYHSCHTMTEAQFNAPGGFPSYFNGLEESGGSTPVDPGTPSEPSTPVDLSEFSATGPFFDLTTAGESTFYSIPQVPQVPENKIRRRHGATIWG